MFALRRVAGVVLRPNARTVVYGFANDTWKERDEAAEKVYISRQESKFPLM